MTNNSLILVLHEPTCERDAHPCNCGMYGVDMVNLQCLGAFNVSEREISEMLSNDSIGG